MATYREIIYMCLDKLKLYSGDSDFTPEHIKFSIDKYRALLLERKYKDVRKGDIPQVNYQTLCLDLIQVPGIPGDDCSGVYLRSTHKIPSLIRIGIRRVFPVDYFTSEMFTWVSKERMQYVGYNPWLKSVIYVTKGVDGYLYLKSSNTQFLHLKKIKLDAIFYNTEEAMSLSCDSEASECDIMDKEFPLEEGLVEPLVQMIVQDYAGLKYLPSDKVNNSKDDMDGMASAIPNKAQQRQ